MHTHTHTHVLLNERSDLDRAGLLALVCRSIHHHQRQANPRRIVMASVARQPAAATSVMARVDRLDLVLSYLEELHHHHHHHLLHHRGGGNMMSTTSSSPSTPSAGSSSSPPRGRGSWRRACRPAREALEEAHAKGSLVDRIAFLEDRVLKMEEEITPETTESSKSDRQHQQRKEKVRDDGNKKKKKKKGFKSIVKSCVRGKLNTTDYY